MQIACDDYEDRRERQRQGVELARLAGKYVGRKADTATHQRIIALRSGGHSIAATAKLARCSQSQVKRVWALNQQKSGTAKRFGCHRTLRYVRLRECIFSLMRVPGRRIVPVGRCDGLFATQMEWTPPSLRGSGHD